MIRYGNTLAASCLLVSALVVAAPRGRGEARARLTGLRLTPAVAHRPARRRDLVRLVAVLAGIATAAVVGGLVGVILGVAAGCAADRLLRRLEPRAARAERLEALTDLPFAADLLAATLRAGAPLSAAAHAVGTALDGPLGDRLCRVARAVALGAPPVDAWSHLSDVAGAGRLVAVAVRTSESGAALAAALDRLAADLRGKRAAAADAAARRAGVLVVLPLGLCFLPAFVLTGLVPIVVSVLGEALS